MKVKITKLKELPYAIHPDNIPEGYSRTIIVNQQNFKEPVRGERFWIGTFSTSIVKEIIDEKTIRTLNSIYEWEIVPE